MQRREVVVDKKVFDLGLVDFEKSVIEGRGKLPTVELEVGGTVFQVGVLRPEKALMLNWWGETSVPNIVWTRFVFLKLGRRPIRRVECFTYAQEGSCVS